MTTTDFPALRECEDKIAAKSQALHSIFDEAGPDYDMSKVKSLSGDTNAKLAEIRKMNEEITDLGKKRDDLKMLAKAAERVRQDPEAGESGDGARKGRGDRDEREVKSLGRLFVESQAFKGRQGKNGPEAHLDIELKTLMSTAAGWAPENTRGPRVVDFATAPLMVIDIVPNTTTTQNSVVYMEETTHTNNAAEVAEGGTYPEAALALTEKDSPVRKIGVWLPVTDEQLEDVPQAEGYINNRLPFMIRQRLNSQILVGNGTAPNLRGVLNVAGIQTQAKGTDPTPDAVYKAMVKVMTTGQALPDAYVTNPLDWQDIRLLRTADGIYIWGNPSDAGPERIWGLRVALEQGLTENTGLVGDFGNFSELSVRRGVDVQVTNAHSDFFINGKQAVRADLRAAFVIYRPAAFCSVTGI